MAWHQLTETAGLARGCPASLQPSACSSALATTSLAVLTSAPLLRAERVHLMRVGGVPGVVLQHHETLGAA